MAKAMLPSKDRNTNQPQLSRLTPHRSNRYVDTRYVALSFIHRFIQFLFEVSGLERR